MRFVFLAAALVLVSAPARADVVDPPPTNCPTGSRGFTCHGGVGCEPDACTTDADCSGPLHCGMRRLCTGSLDCFWSGPQQTVVDTCEDHPCEAGSTCEMLGVCVPDGAPDSGPPRVDAATVPDAASPADAASVPDAASGIDARVGIDSSTDDAGDGRMVTVGGCGCGVSGRGGVGAVLGVGLALALVIRVRRRAALR